MDATTAALVGAGIGAGGAVVAQTIAALASARSATKRFKWEQDQAERASQRERTVRFLDDKREMYAKFLASHVDFREALMMSETTAALSRAQERLSADSEVARQIIVLVAPHMDPYLAEVYDQFKPAAAEKYAWLHSRDHKLQDPYFAKFGEAIGNCRRAMSDDLIG